MGFSKMLYSLLPLAIFHASWLQVEAADRIGSVQADRIAGKLFECSFTGEEAHQDSRKIILTEVSAERRAQLIKEHEDKYECRGKVAFPKCEHFGCRVCLKSLLEETIDLYEGPSRFEDLNAPPLFMCKEPDCGVQMETAFVKSWATRLGLSLERRKKLEIMLHDEFIINQRRQEDGRYDWVTCPCEGCGYEYRVDKGLKKIWKIFRRGI